MAKKSSNQWTAVHRYGDVYECEKGDVSLSHSIKGLKRAAAALEDDGGDFALKQLQVVTDKLEAISAVPGATPRAGRVLEPAENVEAEAGE